VGAVLPVVGISARVGVDEAMLQGARDEHREFAMDDRSFNEMDLRGMLEHAADYRADILEGRFVITARHAGRPWEVIVDCSRRRPCDSDAAAAEAVPLAC
jgi:hypothetical protein